MSKDYGYTYALTKKEMRTSGIYAYWDPIYDEIVYVGKSKNMWNRNIQHYSLHNYSLQPIEEILLKERSRYGFIVLKKCPISQLDYWEKTLIALFNPRYNQQKRYRPILVER